MDLLDISIVTPFMNREEFIDQVLPSWLKLPVKEIVILDWSSIYNIDEIINKYQDGRIYRVHVPNKTSYHRTKSLNTGMRFSANRTKYILKVDCDIILNEKLFDEIEFKDQLQGSNDIPRLREDIDDLNNLSLYGTYFISSEMFLKSNGYNEIVEGWGNEDDDFYRRIKSNYSSRYIHPSIIGNHIEHGEMKRRENLSEEYKHIGTGDQIAINHQLCVDNPWGGKTMESFKCDVFEPNGNVITKIV